MSKVAEVNQTIEPSFDAKLPEGVNRVTQEEAARRDFTAAGCDWSYFLTELLRGDRVLDVTPEEILKTQLYARSNEMERRALRIVTEPEYPSTLTPSPEDSRYLHERDQALVDYIDGKNVDSDFAEPLTAIPSLVENRLRCDAALFPRKIYDEPTLFSWVWDR